jgi:hypothetical protein
MNQRFSALNQRFLALPSPSAQAVASRYIADAATQEWSMMAHGTATLAEAMQATLALTPSSEGQKTAQREITTALETALDARRQRIIISQSLLYPLKPVRLPPGRLRLATSPNCTGSAATLNTIGMLVAAALAARAGSNPTATIALT